MVFTTINKFRKSWPGCWSFTPFTLEFERDGGMYSVFFVFLNFGFFISWGEYGQ